MHTTLAISGNTRIAPIVKNGWLHSSRLLAALVLALFAVDLMLRLAAPGSNWIKAVDYGVRLAVGVTVLALGLRAMARPAQRPGLTYLSVAAYLAIVCVAAFISFLNGAQGFLFFHPSYSLFTWALPVAVLACARISSALTLVGVWASKRFMVLLLLAIAAAWEIAGMDPKVYTPTIAVVVLLHVTLIEERAYFYSASVLAATFALMVYSDYRSYAMAAGFMLVAKIMRLGRPIPSVLTSVILLALPLLYLNALHDPAEYVLFGRNVLADTRTFLMVEVWGQLLGGDFLFGRGLAGTYFSEYFYSLQPAFQDKADHYVRSGVEMGVLNTILKLGVVGLVAFLAVYFSIMANRVDPRAYSVAEKLRTFSLCMFLLFVIELPQMISFAYLMWFMVLGALLSVRRR